MFISTIIAIGITLLAPRAVFASCGHGIESIHPFSAAVDGTVPVPAFTYGTTTGPLNWHNLNQTAYYLCGNGTNQSPILLDSSSAHTAPHGSIKLDVPPAKNVVFENLGTNVEVIINGTLKAAGKTYKLAQFHFHTPSEHRVDLGHYEAEMHFVFDAAGLSAQSHPCTKQANLSGADGSGKVAVLAFFVEVEAQLSTPVLETIFSHLPAIQTPGTTTTVPKVDLSAFQEQANKLKYYQYTGSLTTPPCSEGVSWFLATSPIPLSLKTYVALKDTTKTNNRYTQNSLGQTNILVVASKHLTAYMNMTASGVGAGRFPNLALKIKSQTTAQPKDTAPPPTSPCIPH
ncbi:hypothetical protein HWV62_11277 [Athelia sp. TMB]|nr:hypothetical protein HWV62_11277 [Athelia sp. TMB]